MEMIDEEKKRKSFEYFDHEVKKWLQNAKVCRRCLCVMNVVSGGVLPNEEGKYPDDPKKCETYSTYRCPKCNQVYREEIKHIWKEES